MAGPSRLRPYPSSMVTLRYVLFFVLLAAAAIALLPILLVLALFFGFLLIP